MLFHGEKEVQVDFLLLIIMSNYFLFNFIFRKPIYKKNYKNNFKRNRFNSDNAPNRFQNNNNNNRIPQKENQEIEIDISNLKYSINSKLIYFLIKNFIF